VINLKDEIKEILNELESLFEISESPEHIINGFNKIKYYITNLQTIEQQYSAILSENAELKNKIFDLEDTLIDKKEYCYGLETQLTILQKENDRLKEKENKLQEKFKDWKKEIEKERKHYLCDRTDCCGRIKNSRKYNSIYQELKTCKSRNEKANEYIKENTRWFDSEYAKIYGELVDCAGAKGDRLEVLVNPSNLSKILGGDKDVKEAKD
jgi:chromosome segregation ATPase